MELSGTQWSGAANAILLSPQIAKGPKCVSFWYHMLGTKIGALNVYAYDGKAFAKPIWTRSGSSGKTSWQLGQITVPSANPFQVGFEGTKVVWNSGHIAIDDVKVTDGACAGKACEEIDMDYSGGDLNWCGGNTQTWQLCSESCRKLTTCTHWTWCAKTIPSIPINRGQCCLKSKLKGFTRKVIPGLISGDADCGKGGHPGSCDFETDACSFTNATGDWNWVRNSYSVTKKGPPKDNTDGTATGSYLMATGTAGKTGRTETKFANLAAAGSCATFWYYMDGNLVDSGYKLNVYVNKAAGSKPAFTMSFDHGTTWKQAGVNVKGTSATVQFEGIYGAYDNLHLAIDDVTIKAGLCDPPGVCNFENGFCSWSNQLGDDFDWTVNSGGTPSGGTGPTGDRNGDKNAKYLYIETSYPRTQGEVARLESDDFTGPTAGDQCFIFWFHMYGSDVGALNIYEKINNQTENLIWQLKKEKKNSWINGQVNVGSSGKPFQIIIEGVVGSSYMGDISIDDFSMKKGHCNTLPAEADVKKPVTTAPPPVTTAGPTCVEFDTDYWGSDINKCGAVTASWQLCSSLCGKEVGCKYWTWVGYDKACCTKYGKGVITKNKPGLVSGSADCGVPSPGPLDCDFDSGILCASWKQEKTRDDIDWTLRKGSTTSSGTGPDKDHTQGTKNGGYIYLEASNTKPNQTAQLYSADQSSTGAAFKCFSFYHHMYGAHVNTLNIYTSVHGKIGNPIWSRTGTLGNEWHKGSVNVHARDTYKIVIEALTGSSYQGDIALDDLSLGNSPCVSSSSTCDFEKDQCGYISPIGDKIMKTQFQFKRASKRTGSATGPPTDHTLQSDAGYYMYAPAVSPQKRSDEAALLSPELAATPGGCLMFWYYMSGAQMGGLAIYLKRGDIITYPPLWQTSGDKGKIWRPETVTIKSPRDDFELYMVSKLGGATGSDVALDDISYWGQGPCSTGGENNFERFGLGTWMNLKKDDFDWIIHSGQTPSVNTGPVFDHTIGSAAGCVDMDTD
jgi:hypothetical protein